MTDEVSIPMSLPLDGDGFLRRECPTCEREFKCIVSQDEDDATPAPEGGYFCPYCAVQAPPGAWWTKPQLEVAHSLMFREVIEPELKGLQKSIDQLNRHSGPIGISAQMEVDRPDEPGELTEIDDMRRADFTCHPEDPVKVLEEWERPVHCMICGEPAAPS